MQLLKKQTGLVLLVILVVLSTLVSYHWFYSKVKVKDSGLRFLPYDIEGVLGLQRLAAKDFYNNLSDYCAIPTGGFTSWNQGMVSVLEPVISRNCSLLFANDQDEITRVRAEAKKAGTLDVLLNKNHPLHQVENCTWLLNDFTDNFYTSQEEWEFPLAFTFVVHQYPQQFFRLLKVIYRPHNIYCIHLDEKASDYTKRYVKVATNCLPNVFTPKKIENVYWGHHSLMDAQLSCFSDLLKVHKHFSWNYVIPLCGKELPLRTNREIVRALKSLEGNSGVNAFAFPKKEEYRVKFKHVLSKGRVVRTKKLLGRTPHDIKLYKSMMFFSLTPDFVDFLLHNKTAIELRNFLINAFIPEENYYASLYMIPGVPGGFKPSLKGHIPVVDDYVWLTMSFGPDKNWKDYCNGLNVHNICIISVGDLFRLKYRPKNVLSPKGPMFHNKYFMEYDHVVMDCCEEELVRRNQEEHRTDCEIESQ